MRHFIRVVNYLRHFIVSFLNAGVSKQNKPSVSGSQARLCANGCIVNYDSPFFSFIHSAFVFVFFLLGNRRDD